MNQYYWGGYYLVKPTYLSRCINDRKVPSKVYTVSDCICDIFPSTWALPWVTSRDWELERAKSVFGILDFDSIHTHLNQLFDQELFGWPNVICDLKTAHTIYNGYLRNIEDIKLLAIGLPTQYMDEVLEDLQPGEGQGSSGLFLNLSKRILLDCTKELGFDVLGLDYPSLHSHLCHGINYEICDEYSIPTNIHGFIDSFAEAEKLAEVLLEPQSGAEPAFWLPWKVVELPLAATD